jgi:hypothetical protein
MQPVGFPEFVLVFRIATALGVVAAVFFAFKLYLETDKKWYWGALVLSAFFLALSQWSFILLPFVSHWMLGPVRDTSDVLASVLFAVACYGMYSTMHKIRKRVE